MKIGIIGSGNIGLTAAKLFVNAGHQVALSNSRGPQSLRAEVADLGPLASAVTVEEAARFGDIVLVATPFFAYPDLPAKWLKGKIVVDAMNYYPDRDGRMRELDDDITTSSEVLAEFLPDATIVKAFNTIWYEHLATQGDRSLAIEDRRAIFIAGDDLDSNVKVSQLINDIGFAPVYTGTLAVGGRRQNVGTEIYNVDVTAHQANAMLL